MTVDEYRRVLDALTDEQFERFKNSWGGAANRTREECVQEFVYVGALTRAQWEETALYRLSQLGIRDLPKTEAEKTRELESRTADATVDAATAATESARWAKRSFIAACVAIGVSLLALVISILLAAFGKR